MDSQQTFLKYPAFANFSSRERKKLSHLGYVRTFKTEEQIYPQDSPAAATYYLIDGSVGLFKSQTEKIPDRIQYIQSPHCFGYEALFGIEKRQQGAVALETCTALAIFKIDFLNLCSHDPRFALKLLISASQSCNTDLVNLQNEYLNLTAKLTRGNILI